jgi:hypothetical protein
MSKIAVIVGGVVLMAGVALAGTLTSLGSADTPAGQPISPPATTTTGILDDRGQENELRGREDENGVRGRENEAGEDLRGPCDEAEHANDPRCTGAAVPSRDDDAEDAGDDHSNRGPGGGDDHSNRGPGGDDDNSGHGGDDD